MLRRALDRVIERLDEALWRLLAPRHPRPALVASPTRKREPQR